MAQLIPLSRLSRLVGQPRSVLQRMAQDGVLKTFDGQVTLEEVLRHFPDVELQDDAEIRRVEQIKADASVRPSALRDLPDAAVLFERLKALSRDFAAANGRLVHLERVFGWIGDKMGEAVERREATPQFADSFMQWLKRELSTLPGDIRRWEELLARERIMRVMTAHVTVLPKRQTFEVVGDESILEAGLRAGIALPYGCSNGTCGDCKCRVVKGDVMRVRPHDYVLSAADKTQGYTLACSYSAVGDIEIDVSLWGVGDIPEQTIKTRVRSVERLGDRRIALHLLTPRAERLRYMAGQRVEITAAGQTRMVPAASCPCEERRIEVHVAWDEGDAWGTAAAALKTSEDVVVHGPFGSFVLDDESQRPMLLIAADHGFAPIKSLLQHALSLDHAPSISLYRLAGPDGLYQENLLKSYAGALDNFDYHAFENSAGHGALLGALGAALPDLSAFDVYAAGQEDFIAAVEAHCRTRGVTADRFRADAVT